MNHFRDRIITTPNIPQLPSGKVAVANVPAITQRAGVASSVIVSIHTATPPTVVMASLVPTQTVLATSP